MVSGTPLQLSGYSDRDAEGKCRSNQLSYFCLEFQKRGTRNSTQPIENNFTEFLAGPDLGARIKKRQNELAVLDKLLVGSTRPRLIGAAFSRSSDFVWSWTNQLRKKI
jgi:hypothetical protein